MSRRIETSSTFLAAAFIAFSSLQSGAQADPVAQFYEGKTISFIVGAANGGGYDAQARLLASHMGRFLPGSPNVVVQNMPGAGSLQAANFLYNLAPKDGSTIALLQRGILSTRFVNPEGARFDLGKFNWIGNMSSEAGVVLAWHSTPFNTFEDLKKQDFLVGGTGPMIDTETTPYILNALLGTRFKVITGYKGTGDTSLAMERGELHGMGDWSWSNVKTRRPDYFRDNKVRVLAQMSAEKLPDLPDVPTLREMGFDIPAIYNWMGFFAPAATPPATINLLNKEITAALVEPATAKWLAEIGFGIMASSPAELDRFVVSEIDRWRAFVKEFNVRFD